MQRSILNSSFVAKSSQTCNHSLSLVTQITMMSKRLPLMHICDMDLEEGYIHASQRISQGYTGMGEGTWIDDYSVDVTAGFVDAIDQGAFPVRLEVVEGYCEG